MSSWWNGRSDSAFAFASGHGVRRFGVRVMFDFFFFYIILKLLLLQEESNIKNIHQSS